MQIAKGDLVLATAGRENGGRYFVLAAEERYVYLADGVHRRVDAPKRKSRRHVRLLARPDGAVAGKIRSSEPITNSELRKAIAASGVHGEQDQEGVTTWQNPT